MNGNLAFIHDIKGTDNPILKSAKLTFYISDGLKNQKLNLYEAYLLQQEVICFTRDGYILPAWNGKVRISTCLALLNQRLLAQAFHDMNYVQLLKEYGAEAFGLCAEKGKHYIMDSYNEFLNMDCEQEDLLRKMLAVRESNGSLSDNDGPYHVEVFPWHYFEPERILLENTDMGTDRQISEDTELILIEINT